MVNQLVESQQMTFIQGRQIVDARTKRKEPGVLYKLDIEKLYDHLNWNFLVEILSKMD